MFLTFPLQRSPAPLKLVATPSLTGQFMRFSHCTIFLFLLTACTSTVDVQPVSLVTDSLGTFSPSNWEEITSGYPSCAILSEPVGQADLIEVPPLRIALALPAGAEFHDPGDDPEEMSTWTFALDSATLSVMRMAGIRGSANYMMMLEGAEMEEQGTCGHFIGRHAALVRRFRFQLPERVLYGATVQLIPATGESLGGSVLAPRERRRENLLSVLLHLRVDSF